MVMIIKIRYFKGITSLFSVYSKNVLNESKTMQVYTFFLYLENNNSSTIIHARLR